MASPNLSLPAGPVPSGIVSEFANPPNHAALAYTALSISLLCVTVFTGLRLLVKLFIIKTTHTEDYILPLAWLAAVGHIVCAFIICSFAPIVHIWDIQLGAMSRFLLYFRLGSIFYNISICFIKVAMLIQVLRIFFPRGQHSQLRRFVYLLIWVTALYYSATVLAMIFTCTPVQKAWKPWLHGKCVNMGAISMTTASVNLFTDLTILAVCQRVIWRLIKIDQKKQVKLSIVFCAGIVPCIFSAMCLYYNNLMMHSPDFTYDSAFMSLACHGEIASGMFVLLLPVLPRSFSWLRERLAVQNHHTAKNSCRYYDVTAAIDTSKIVKKASWHIILSDAGDGRDFECAVKGHIAPPPGS